MPSLVRLFAAFFLVFVAAVLGTLATTPNLAGWYEGLAKPAFNPPNWIFGPVWTLLYICMAFALFRILSLPSASPGRTRAIVCFLVQLALNALWSWAFFAAHSPLAGVIVIVALIVALATTVALFRPLDRFAAALLLPYLAWVCFAALLNLSIWHLNA